MTGLSSGFAQIVNRRVSVRGFDKSKDLPEKVVIECLKLAQRAPSGFNVQPYKAVVVRDELVKEQLAYAMLGGNIKKVLDAPVTTVFLADLQPYRLIDQVVEMERNRKGKFQWTEYELGKMKSSMELFLGNAKEERDTKQGEDVLTMFLKKQLPLDIEKQRDNVNCLEQQTKQGLMNLLSHFTQTPTINARESWAFKNTMLAAQIFLLGISSYGFDSCPMEGFDQRRVKQVLSVPEDRYHVPIVIACGKTTEEEQVENQESPRPRFRFEDVFCRDTFDFPLYNDDDKKEL